jgi:hypothetical protein
MINLAKGMLAMPLFFLALAGCKAEDPVLGVLQRNSCALPWWNEITPGETGKETALRILQNPSIVERGSLEEPYEGIYLARLNGGAAIEIEFQGKTVRYFSLKLSEESPTTIGELIATLGEPDLVRPTFEIPPHGEPPCYQSSVPFLL